MIDLTRFLTLALCLLALGGVSSSALAQDDGVDFVSDEPEPLVAGEVTATKGATSVTTLTETNFASTSSTTFVNLASTTVTIPAGQTGRILASFGGQTSCEGTNNNGWCAIRVLVDGTEMLPQSGSEFAFTSPRDVAWETKSVDRVSHVLSAGSHTVVLQWAAVAGATSFTLFGWQLKLAVWRVS